MPKLVCCKIAQRQWPVRKYFDFAKKILFLQLAPLLKDLQGAKSIPMQIATIFQTLSQHGHNFCTNHAIFNSFRLIMYSWEGISVNDLVS